MDTLVEQLIHIQRSHGELCGIVVKTPLESTWCDPPIPTATKAHDAWEGTVSCHIWTESSQYANAWHDFERLCPELLDLAVHVKDGCDESLSTAIRAATADDDRVLRWLWFIAGFSVTKLPGRTPRTNRKCWGINGHLFVADKLESQRENLPKAIAGNMPPDASCWLIRVDDIIQTSIEAVDYLASTLDDPTQWEIYRPVKEWAEITGRSVQSINDILPGLIESGLAKRWQNKPRGKVALAPDGLERLKL